MPKSFAGTAEDTCTNVRAQDTNWTAGGGVPGCAMGVLHLGSVFSVFSPPCDVKAFSLARHIHLKSSSKCSSIQMYQIDLNIKVYQGKQPGVYQFVRGQANEEWHTMALLPWQVAASWWGKR